MKQKRKPYNEKPLVENQKATLKSRVCGLAKEWKLSQPLNFETLYNA